MGKHARFKISHGESLSRKLTKARTFRNFNKTERGAILAAIGLGVAFRGDRSRVLSH